MDPISLLTAGVQVASLGMSIFAGQKAAQTQGQIAQQSGAIAQDEIQADAQRRQAMELDAQRKNMEVLRNSQRARAVALNNATNQGAQFGSGLQGGYGQIEGASSNNLLGISQNLGIGENLFNINADVDQHKLTIAQLGGDLASEQGQAAMWKGIGNIAGVAGNFAKGFNPFGGGSPGGGQSSAGETP